MVWISEIYSTRFHQNFQFLWRGPHISFLVDLVYDSRLIVLFPIGQYPQFSIVFTEFHHQCFLDLRLLCLIFHLWKQNPYFPRPIFWNKTCYQRGHFHFQIFWGFHRFGQFQVLWFLLSRAQSFLYLVWFWFYWHFQHLYFSLCSILTLILRPK